MLLIYLFLGWLPSRINLAFLVLPLCNFISFSGFRPKLPSRVFHPPPNPDPRLIRSPGGNR